MAIDLYYTPGSAPCRIVMLTAASLGIQINIILVDFDNEEHLKPEFLKINPQHTVPVIRDNGFIIWESRAIARYLVNKYGGESTLYPKDLQLRAVVDQRMDFDIGTLYSRFADYYYPKLFGGKPANEEILTKLEDALGCFNTFLEGNKYAAGDHYTLADISLVTTVSTIELSGISLKKYPNVERWYELVKATVPGYGDANQKDIDEYKDLIVKYLGSP